MINKLKEIKNKITDNTRIFINNEKIHINGTIQKQDLNLYGNHLEIDLGNAELEIKYDQIKDIKERDFDDMKQINFLGLGLKSILCLELDR